MKLEASLVRMAGLRIGFLVILPLVVKPFLQVVLKKLGKGLPGM